MSQQIRYLLYQWKKEYEEMAQWSKFNSLIDRATAYGELVRLRKNIEELEEIVGQPKGNDWVDYALKKNLDFRKANGII